MNISPYIKFYIIFFICFLFITSLPDAIYSQAQKKESGDSNIKVNEVDKLEIEKSLTTYCKLSVEGKFDALAPFISKGEKGYLFINTESDNSGNAERLNDQNTNDLYPYLIDNYFLSNLFPKLISNKQLSVTETNVMWTKDRLAKLAVAFNSKSSPPETVKAYFYFTSDKQNEWQIYDIQIIPPKVTY